MPQKLSSYWSAKPLTRSAVNVFAKKTVRQLKPGKRVLDLGCGYGKDSIYFARKGLNVTALDFSRVGTEHIRKEAKRLGYDIDVRYGDLSKKLPFKNGSFDAVYAHLSLHYFDDRKTQEIFEEVRRVLKPGGFFFVKCKSVDDPLYGKGKEIGTDMFLHDHVRHFFHKEFMEFLLAHWAVLSVRRTSSTYVDYRSNFIEAIARKH
ncbi:MAG TPA: class I SAM-dependent methyltransferase [Candidatus Peribacteraceae bacterium]|nr:class I SAM-dependent methyltransferase [Candidatus Peribacteraceae bacterium]